MQAEKSYNYQKMSMKLNKQKGYEDIWGNLEEVIKMRN